MASGDEVTRLQYVKDLHIFKAEKPFVILSNLKAKNSDHRKTNLEFEYGELQTITDLRGRKELFSLDSHGFHVCSHDWDMDNWYSKRAVEGEYFREIEDLLKTEIPGITKVKIFDWRMRRNQGFEEAGIKSIDLNDNSQFLHPIPVVHIDQTPKGALRRVRHHMGEETQTLLKGRVRLIKQVNAHSHPARSNKASVWRPIKHAVGDWPLAVCDGSTVDFDDLLAVDHVTRSYIGETYKLLYREKYRWYYLSQQKPNEVLLFKMYDSNDQVEAKYCPHASFQHKNIPEGTLPRESIEVRALVFSDS